MNASIPKKILIVEDSRLNAQITADILSKYGYKTEMVRTGEEAVEKARSSQGPDLILMDIELGRKIGGIDTARIIKQFKDIPIVFLTANTGKEIMEKIRSVTGYGYVLKGVDEYVLVSTVEMALKLHEANIRVKQSEELFRNMFETNEAVMLLIEPESGHIIDAHRAACRFYGYPKESLLQMDMGAINLSSSINGAQECMEAFKNNCNPCVCVHRLASGEERLVEIYSSPANYLGKVLLYLIIFDITARWQAEKELKFYRYLFENSLNEIYIFHPETLKFIAVNRGARENLGYSQEELNEMTPLDLKPDFDLQSLRELLAPLSEGKQERIIFNTVHRRKDGSLCFGHAAGDMVLKSVAYMIKRRIRKTDCLARWGGEEFIILLPETSVEYAAGLAEELREQLSSMTLPEVGRVTASFGVTGYRTSDTIDTILMRADSMLYEAKDAGRNCVKSQ